ncbi:MAG TPA: hypothetical protein VKF35_24220, partial [Hyphomicrobiaceae bacterium]|nr:hypothetical protein [Hyphomicrobiaceae bacterium]
MAANMAPPYTVRQMTMPGAFDGAPRPTDNKIWCAVARRNLWHPVLARYPSLACDLPAAGEANAGGRVFGRCRAAVASKGPSMTILCAFLIVVISAVVAHL